jgi:hypothetical protein
MRKEEMERKNTRQNTSDAVLSTLAKKILIAMNIDGVKLKLLIDRFVKRLGLDDNKVKSHTKANLFNYFLANKMSIKTFIRLIMVLNATNVEFSVKLKFQNGTEKTVSVSYNMNVFESEASDEQN